MLWIALVPLAVSLPFLWWDESAFVSSIWSSAVRPAAGYGHVSAVGSLLGLHGGPARIPLLLLATLILYIVSYQAIGQYTTILLMFTVLTDFNTVLFPQYFAWVIPADCLSSR